MPLFGQMYNFAHWLTQNRDEAEDLVQETYMKALKAFGSFQPGTNFRAWIYRILRNTFLNTRSGRNWQRRYRWITKRVVQSQQLLRTPKHPSQS